MRSIIHRLSMRVMQGTAWNKRQFDASGAIARRGCLNDGRLWSMKSKSGDPEVFFAEEQIRAEIMDLMVAIKVRPFWQEINNNA